MLGVRSFLRKKRLSKTEKNNLGGAPFLPTVFTYSRLVVGGSWGNKVPSGYRRHPIRQQAGINSDRSSSTQGTNTHSGEREFQRQISTVQWYLRPLLPPSLLYTRPLAALDAGHTFQHAECSRVRLSYIVLRSRARNGALPLGAFLRHRSTVHIFSEQAKR